jgi:hypothetical protein
MDNVVSMSDQPFQVRSLSLTLAALLAVRTLLAFLVPFSILSKITHGLLLKVLVVAALVLLAVLSLVGEFTIRAFMAARRMPTYAVLDGGTAPVITSSAR